MKRRALFGAAVGIALAIVAATAVPAGAAELPDDEQLYSVDEELKLWAIDETTGVATLIGGGSAALNNFGADYDPTSGQIYIVGFLMTDFVNDTRTACQLYSMDISTGQMAYVGPVMDGATALIGCEGLDILPSGQLWVVGAGTRIVEVDKASGTVLGSQEVTGLVNSWSWSIAVDPITGVVYVADNAWAAVDPATWVSMPTNLYSFMYGADFDSLGRLWFTGGGPGCPTAIGSSTPDLVDFTARENYSDVVADGVCIGAFSLFVGPAASELPSTEPPASQLATLAATGTSPVHALLAGTLGLLVGATLVVTRRNTRRETP